MLTDTQLRRLQPAERPRKYSDGRGLYLLVTPMGGKYWRYNYRYEGKQKTLSLGVYPDVSLARARERLQEARTQLTEDIDPSFAKKTTGLTFEEVARRWFEHWSAGRHQRHAHYVMRRLEADVFPQIGSRLVVDIPTSAFRDAVKKVEARGALDIAKRILQTCGQIMRYAVAHDLAQRNPVADVKPADILKSHKKRNYPRVDEVELPKLLAAVETYAGSEITRLALQMMALTFVRTSELIGARWSEFDLKADRWSIPAERMKMDTPHIVPLSRQAKAVLAQLAAISGRGELVFPGDQNPNKPMSNNTILYALYRMGYHGRMTGHGFRGVASTILHEQGWPHEHIELQLAHQPRNAVSAAYNHALYLKPRGEMMQAWADHLDMLCTTPMGETDDQ
jgi:integrase